MLLEFSVANFRSLKERVTLSLEASSDDWLQDSHVETVGGRRVLKSAAIYGPNAGGKSNLLRAMELFRNIIQGSSKDSQLGERLPVVPFRLHTDTEHAPTLFEAVFIHGGTRYRYGFETTAEAIHSEWLFSQKDSTRETKLFVREKSSIKLSAEFREGKGLEERTRANALFLSVVAQFNGKIAGEIMAWMAQLLIISGVQDEFHMQFTRERLREQLHRNATLELIRRADIGIEDLLAEDVPLSQLARELPKEFPEPLRQLILGANSSAFALKTYHKKFDAKDRECGRVEFNFKSDESAGTQKLLAMSGPFLHALEHGAILVVDEMEARLHPLLTRALVGLFHEPANRKGAQLIYATQDEGLLDSARVRRDQVWFVEKDDYGASLLFSLAEFKVRKEAKFAKEYLLGQYGGVPHLRDLQAALNYVK